MRKILLSLIIVLLVITAYYSIVKGITLGKFEISSINQIKDKNEDLDKKIERINVLIDTEYPNKINSLKVATLKMEEAKKEYLKLTNISSNDQIIKATTQESYSIELLWTKIGRHAMNKGVNIDMQVQSNNTGVENFYNLKFTVKGSYLAIINFIEAIENDSVLNFRVNNFKLLPNSGSILQATFIVQNVAIQGNTSSLNVNATVTTNDETDNSSK